VFGVWASGEPVANLVYGLYTLQHRGQESARVAVGDGHRMVVFKDMRLVSQAFDEATLATLQGHLAIGHTRYSTTGGSCSENAQPAFKTNAAGRGIALPHNGNLTITAALAAELAGDPQGDTPGGQPPSAAALRRSAPGRLGPVTPTSWSSCWPARPTCRRRGPSSAPCPG
jgi:amidophosphoribosyltransferase